MFFSIFDYTTQQRCSTRGCQDPAEPCRAYPPWQKVLRASSPQRCHSWDRPYFPGLAEEPPSHPALDDNCTGWCRMCRKCARVECAFWLVILPELSETTKKPDFIREDLLDLQSSTVSLDPGIDPEKSDDNAVPVVLGRNAGVNPHWCSKRWHQETESRYPPFDQSAAKE